MNFELIQNDPSSALINFSCVPGAFSWSRCLSRHWELVVSWRPIWGMTQRRMNPWRPFFRCSVASTRPKTGTVILEKTMPTTSDRWSFLSTQLCNWLSDCLRNKGKAARLSAMEWPAIELLKFGAGQLVHLPFSFLTNLSATARDPFSTQVPWSERHPKSRVEIINWPLAQGTPFDTCRFSSLPHLVKAWHRPRSWMSWKHQPLSKTSSTCKRAASQVLSRMEPTRAIWDAASCFFLALRSLRRFNPSDRNAAFRRAASSLVMMSQLLGRT